jgi:hypothetical protein
MIIVVRVANRHDPVPHPQLVGIAQLDRDQSLTSIDPQQSHIRFLIYAQQVRGVLSTVVKPDSDVPRVIDHMFIGDDKAPAVEDKTGTVTQTSSPPFPFGPPRHPAFITFTDLIDVNESGGDDTDHAGGNPISNIRKRNLPDPSLAGIYERNKPLEKEAPEASEKESRK